MGQAIRVDLVHGVNFSLHEGFWIVFTKKVMPNEAMNRCLFCREKIAKVSSTAEELS